MNKILEFKRFTFGYDQKDVVSDISFVVNKGEYISIIGPNGAGKSTVLKCINRIIKGGRGSIRIFDKDLNTYAQKELGRLIGYVPQTREQLFPFTVQEFLLMSRYPYLNPFTHHSKEDERVIEHALNMTDLKGFAQRRVNQLSGGERQRVYLAAALAQEPKILLLDEPTAHLDPKHHSQILQMILEINQTMKMTVLHVTHDLSHMANSQRILALHQGQLQFNGPSQEVLTHENLFSIFGTDFLIMNDASTKQRIVVPKV